jgi:hypothetical protein
LPNNTAHSVRSRLQEFGARDWQLDLLAEGLAEALELAVATSARVASAKEASVKEASAKAAAAKAASAKAAAATAGAPANRASAQPNP